MRLDRRWAVLALLFPLTVARAAADTDYAYAFALNTPQSAEAYRIVLNPAVYASANPAADLRDLVVVNALGRPVPFGPLPPAPPISHPFKLEARLLPVPSAGDAARDGVQVERSANGGIMISQPAAGATPQRPKEWLVDAGRETSLDEIALMADSLQQDFQLHLAVDSSNDLRQWQLVADEASVVRVHGEGDNVEQLSISVEQAGQARYYRLRLLEGEVDWSAGRAPALKLTGHYTDAAADRASQLQWLVATSSVGTGGDYDYALPAALPLEAVKVVLPAANAAARVRVLLPRRDGATWSALATLDLVRAAGKGGDATAQVETPPVQHLRLHSDTPLAQAPQLMVGWVPAQYVFMAEGSGPYRLLVGSYAARRGDYPLEPALVRLRNANGADWLPPQAALGERVDAAGPSVLQAPKVPYDWTKPLLWVVLVAGALVVAYMAMSLLRQSKREGDAS